MDKPTLVLLVHGLQEKRELISYVREYSENADYTTIIVEPADGANISTISYGSTTGWYDQNPEEDNNSAGRVLKLEVDSSKKYGTTYHMIFHTNGDTLYTNGYSGWMPVDTKTRYPAYYQDGIFLENI